MDDAEVTVLLAARPDEPFLKAALDSLAAQHFTNWLCLLILDGQSERNRRIAEESPARQQLRVLEISGGHGLAAALNNGLHQVDSPLVARMDADDICLPQRLGEQVKVMHRRPELGVLGSSAQLIDNLGRVTGYRGVTSGVPQVRRQLMWRNALIHPSVIFRTQVVRGVGGYNEKCKRMQDYELWLRLLAVSDFDNLPDPLIQYRVSGRRRYPIREQTRAIRQIRDARISLAHGVVQRTASEFRQLAWAIRQVS